MSVTKALVKLATHTAHITQAESGLITILKYNEYCCDMDQFTSRWNAADFIVEPLPTHYYRVTVTGEE